MMKKYCAVIKNMCLQYRKIENGVSNEKGDYRFIGFHNSDGFGGIVDFPSLRIPFQEIGIRSRRWSPYWLVLKSFTFGDYLLLFRLL